MKDLSGSTSSASGGGPGADRVAARAAEMIRRSSTPLRLGMVLVSAIVIVIPVLLGLPWLAGIGVLLLAALTASLLVVERPELFRPAAHLVYLMALGAVGYAVFSAGLPPVITVYFSSIVLLAAAQALGARAALIWSVPYVALIAAGAFFPPPVEREVAPAFVFATRAATVLTILGFAVSFRRAQDRQSMELEARATTDALTGLGNRRELDRALAQALDRSERFGRHGALVFLDLDGMKRINDRFGHAAGDSLLRETAQRIQTITRSVDVPARMGGDEFVILLSEFDDPKGAEIYTRKLLRALEEPFHVEGLSVLLSASVGVALFPETARDARTLLRRADEAMYEAKRAGGARIRLRGADGLHEVV